MNKLKYKIISFSSQNVQYPISNLITGQGIWQSDKFCTYPQQITIMFYQPVQIQKIKIITHNLKIPQKIHILYHLPIQNNQNQFNKLGYITFKQPNQQSYNQNPQIKTQKLKQLKVINNLQINSQYLRFIISKNYTHKTNIFNQVAISTIIVEGQKLNLQQLKPLNLKNNSFIQVNNFIQSKINLLNQFKQNCIKREQYNQAKQIKQIIKQINELLKEIQFLNTQKVQLIHQQNYLEATKIKNQIQIIKNNIQEMSNNFYDPSNKRIKTFSIEKFKSKSLSLINELSHRQNYQNQFLKNQSDPHIITHQNKQQNEENQEQINQNQTINHEQKILPTLLTNVRNIQYLTQRPEQNISLYNSRIQQTLPQQPQQISPSNLANASILTEFYQKKLIMKLHSKYWQFKNQAIEQILIDCKKNQNSLISKNQLKAYLFVYNRILTKQNHKNLINGSIDLINIVLSTKIKQNKNKTDMINQLQKAVVETLNKIQDNQNIKIKQKAQKIIIMMIQSQLFGILTVYHAIIRAYSDKFSSKIKKTYLENLQYLVSKNPQNIKNIIPITIVDFSVKKLYDANNQVRKAAINLLKSLKKAGYKERIKICLSEQDLLKNSYLKELNLD